MYYKVMQEAERSPEMPSPPESGKAGEVNARTSGIEALRYPCSDVPAVGATAEIAPGVTWVRLPLPFALDHVNAWLLTEGGDRAIVDTGLSNRSTQQCWARVLAPTATQAGRLSVYVTHLHPDHVGMAGALVRDHGGKLHMTRREHGAVQDAIAAAKGAATDPARHRFCRRAGWSPEAIAEAPHLPEGFASSVSPLPDCFEALEDHSTFRAAGADWEVVTGSGHSPEHACFYSAQRRLFISGDQVLPRISSNISVFYQRPDANPLADWLLSIAKIRARVAEDVLVLPAHNEPFVGLHARLGQLERGQHEALDRLRSALVCPLSAVDAIQPLFSRHIHRGIQFEMATGESIACLNYLLDREEVTVEDDDQGVARYRLRHSPQHSNPA